MVRILNPKPHIRYRDAKGRFISRKSASRRKDVRSEIYQPSTLKTLRMIKSYAVQESTIRERVAVIEREPERRRYIMPPSDIDELETLEEEIPQLEYMDGS